MKLTRAFTLIELLIVVAIIAILAAIAVPNFIEAQVRAKVSRTKADMRTVATGLEAYKVDSNRYPPDLSVTMLPGSSAALRARVNTFLGRLQPLTTPVAYLSSLPEDFFARSLATSGLPGASTNPWRQAGSTTGALHNPIVYDYASFDRNISDQTGASLDQPANWARFTSNTGAIEWALNSVGPDITDYKFLGQAGITVYDPSNGSISQGQIIRTNLGADDQGTNNN